MIARIRNRILLSAVLFLAGATGLAAWWILPARRAEVRIPPVAQAQNPGEESRDGTFHLQTDPRWAGERLGGSGETVRRVGCTLCCLSMALTQQGFPTDPADLNRRLKAVDGYTRRGWVKWDAIRQVTGGRIRVHLPENPTRHDIDTALAAGDPVLVKVLLASGFQHWVLLVRTHQGEYLMKDPLGDGRSLQPLSSLRSDILAVRIVRKRS